MCCVVRLLLLLLMAAGPSTHFTVLFTADNCAYNKVDLSFLIVLVKQLRTTRGRPSFQFILIGGACLRTGDRSPENYRKIPAESSGTHADGLEQRPLVVPLELCPDLHQVHLTA